eukprot:PhF_6_TR9259/c2_g1_i1/m.14676
MISSVSPILTSAAYDTSVGTLFPRDCLQNVMQFTHTKTTLLMFLVCQSWYHAVDRFVLLGDTFYYLPEMFGDEIIRRRKFPACVSTSVSTLQGDVRWNNVDVMVLKVLDTLQDDAYCFPVSLKFLCL